MENKPAKNKGGRPIKWTESYAISFGEELIDWLSKDNNIWFERFIYEVKGSYPQIISEMSEKYPKFSELIKRAKKIQEGKIVELSLKMALNTTMSIFVLKNHYNWKDKTEQNITLNTEQPLFSNDDLNEIEE